VLNVRKAISIARTGIAQMVGDPLFMVMYIGMPVMMTWIMSFLPREMAGLASSGVIVMFLGLNIVMSATSIIEERQLGTWGRLLSSPVTGPEIMGGYLIKLFAVAWVQSAVLFLSARYLFKAPWSHLTPAAFAVLGSYILAMAGLGVLLATVLRTQQQAPAVATGISVVGTMLGGVFFPAEGNAVMEAVSRVSPQGWAARGLNTVMAEGAGFASVGTPVLWMLGLGLVFLALGLARVKYE
jgi:ABC-2 type transport system permease protein